MKKILFLLSFCCFIFKVNAQTVTVSDDLSIRNDLGYQILGQLKEHVLLFRDKTTGFEVQAFNDKMRATWHKELVLDKRRPKVVDIVTDLDQNSFCVFYLFKRKGETLLKAHKYDPAANLIDSVVVKNFESVFHTPDLRTLASEDKTKIVFYETKSQTEIKAISFDIKKMKLLWDKEYKTAETIYGRDFREILTDNRGDFYLIFESNNKKSKLEKHHFEIIKMNNGPLTSCLINAPKYLRYDVLFEYDNLNNKLVAGGLYSDDNLAWARGFFYIAQDFNTSDSTLIKYHPFSDEFALNFMDKNEKSEKSKKSKGISNTNIREIVLRRDGGILIIGEHNRRLDRGYGNPNNATGINNTFGGRFITDYYYENLFVTSIHPDGALHWNKILHKKQYSQDDDAVFSSYFLTKTPTALRLIFNDEIKYENTVSEYVIKSSGDFTRNSVMSTEGQRLRLRFPASVQINANEIIVPSESRNRLKLVRVKY